MMMRKEARRVEGRNKKDIPCSPSEVSPLGYQDQHDIKIAVRDRVENWSLAMLVSQVDVGPLQQKKVDGSPYLLYGFCV